MASSYSTNLGIELIANGAQSGVWGATTNTNLGTIMEQAIVGYSTQAVTNSTAETVLQIVSGASSVGRNYVIKLTGALTADRVVLVPACQKPYVFWNYTTGGFSVTIKVNGMTGFVLANGKKAIVFVDGSDVQEIVNAPVSELGTQTLYNKTLIGGTTSSSSLVLQSTTTTGGGNTDSIVFKLGNFTSTPAATISSLAYLGIGLTSPGYRLDVREASATSAGMRVVNSSTGASVTAVSVLGTGTSNATLTTTVYDNSGSSYAVFGSGAALTSISHDSTLHTFRSPASSEWMRISSGKMGIGTTDAQSKLDVQGDIGFNSLSTTAGRLATYSLGVSDAGTTGQKAALQFVGSGTYGFLTEFVIKSFDTDIPTSSSVDRLRINTSGNVGIGGAPASFGSTNRLEVITPSGTATRLLVGQTGIGNYSWAVPASVNNLVLYSGASTELLRVDSSGNLNIGPSAPATPTALSITDTSASPTGSANTYGLYLYPVAGGNTFIDALNSSSNTTTMTFRTFNAGTYNTMLFNAVGSLGIGVTPTTDYKLALSGSSKGIQIIDTANTDIKFDFAPTSATAQARIYANLAGGYLAFGVNNYGSNTYERLRVDYKTNLTLGTLGVVGASAENVIAIANGVAPTTAVTGAGQLYVEAGALKYKGAGGTVTTLAVT